MAVHEDGLSLDRGVLRVGLTGGIAAGKTVVACRLTELGATVIDHDVLARAVVDVGTPGLAEVVAEFGPVLTPLGQLDRQALGERVFADPAALERLNAIVHPRVREAAQEAEAAAVAQGTAMVVHDIPLLVETGQAGHFDVLVVVDAPAEVRAQRLVDERGLTRDAAWARLAAQADDEARLEAADVVLDGSGTMADLRAQVDGLWGRLTATGDGTRPAD